MKTIIKYSLEFKFAFSNVSETFNCRKTSRMFVFKLSGNNPVGTKHANLQSGTKTKRQFEIPHTANARPIITREAPKNRTVFFLSAFVFKHDLISNSFKCQEFENVAEIGQLHKSSYLKHVY